MKLSAQLLRSKSGGPLHSAEILNLSSLSLVTFEKIHHCPRLQSVDLSSNLIEIVPNLDCCPELWRIHLQNNKLCSLEGLSRFIAIGTLILSNNELDWDELRHLKHMHILSLSLHGNPKLEKDPNYRVHIIDCLPKLWMLDGKIITTAERTQVKTFFEKSALSEKPVRHKLKNEKFVPSSRKKLEVTGIFGRHTDDLLRKFGRNESLNIGIDHRRIVYMAAEVQRDLFLEYKHVNTRYWTAVKQQENFLVDLLNSREEDRMRCNMLLLLLVASLEFAIPSHLMKEVLRCTRLMIIGNVNTMGLFLLPKEWRCEVVSLLLGAVKLDRDCGEHGGLYDRLFLSLYHSVSDLARLSQGGSRIHQTKLNMIRGTYDKNLIAAEVVQLLCIVPVFFDYITKDSGIKNLVSLATSDFNFIERIEKQVAKMDKKTKRDIKKIYETVAEITLRTIQKTSADRIDSSLQLGGDDHFILNTLKPEQPQRPFLSTLEASEYLSQGRKSPDRKPVRIKSGKPYRGSYIPQAKLGDEVLLGPQSVGRIISIPEPEMILVQMDVVPELLKNDKNVKGSMVSSRSAPDEHYKYLDIDELCYDYCANYWKPKGTVGDRITIHNRTKKDGRKVNKLGTQTNIIEAPHGPSVIKHDQDNYSIRSASPRLTSAANKGSAGDHYYHSKHIPRAVSTRYKEENELRLNLETGVLRKSSLITKSATSEGSVDSDSGTNRRRSTVKSMEEESPLHIFLNKSTDNDVDVHKSENFASAPDEASQYSTINRGKMSSTAANKRKGSKDNVKNTLSITGNSSSLTSAISSSSQALSAFGISMTAEVIPTTPETKPSIINEESLSSTIPVRVSNSYVNIPQPEVDTDVHKDASAISGSSKTKPIPQFESYYSQIPTDYYTQYLEPEREPDEDDEELISTSISPFQSSTDNVLHGLGAKYRGEEVVSAAKIRKEQSKREQNGSAANSLDQSSNYSMPSFLQPETDSMTLEQKKSLNSVLPGSISPMQTQSTSLSKSVSQFKSTEEQSLSQHTLVSAHKPSEKQSLSHHKLVSQLEPSEEQSISQNRSISQHEPTEEQSISPNRSVSQHEPTDEQSLSQNRSVSQQEASEKQIAMNPPNENENDIKSSDVGGDNDDTGNINMNQASESIVQMRAKSAGFLRMKNSDLVHGDQYDSFSEISACNFLERPQSHVGFMRHTMNPPPPQRPSSPYLQRGNKKTTISVLHGRTWLGQGRNLHHEKKQSQPQPYVTAEYRASLIPRPKSGAASRALKRAKTPTIVTPSSLAFEDIYGQKLSLSSHNAPCNSSNILNHQQLDMETASLSGAFDPVGSAGRRLEGGAMNTPESTPPNTPTSPLL